MTPNPLAIVISEPPFFDRDDMSWFSIKWNYYRKNVGTSITKEEELDLFLLELARHFPEATIYLKFDRRNKQVINLSIELADKFLNYPYWKIPPSSPLARFFPNIVAIVHSDRIDRRNDFIPEDNLQYHSIPITQK